MPVLVVARCQGRVMLSQPRLMASNRVGMFAGLGEELRIDIGGHAEPIAQAHEHFAGMVQLAHERLELVAAVAVEEHEFADALALERIDEIRE